MPVHRVVSAHPGSGYRPKDAPAQAAAVAHTPSTPTAAPQPEMEKGLMPVRRNSPHSATLLAVSALHAPAYPHYLV